MKEKTNFEKIALAISIVSLVFMAAGVVLSIANIADTVGMIVFWGSFGVHNLFSGLVQVKTKNKVSAILSFVNTALSLTLVIINIFKV